mmetsp:Transcript_21077/g.43948  ORF Transcript_21077/g.43948 Transcript_21077/m.43948 type:complete len:142 (+) Transcript_21077:22-447(+)
MGGKGSKPAAAADAPFAVKLSDDLVVTLSEIPAEATSPAAQIEDWRKQNGAMGAQADASINHLETSMEAKLGSTTDRINELEYKLSLNPSTKVKGEACQDVQNKLAASMSGGDALAKIKQLAMELKDCVKNDQLENARLSQ